MGVPLELAANVWPIRDEATGAIQRFAARAYCLPRDDAFITKTLKMLAVGDYITAHQFAVPEQFSHVGGDGIARRGVAFPEDFNNDPFAIVEHALADLEADLPKAHGMSVECDHGIEPVRIRVSFPEDPHVMLTYLIEPSDGRLRPVLSKDGPKHF